MNSNSSWHKFQAFFFNSTLRFSILRAICIFAILLICNVPTSVLKIPLIECKNLIITGLPGHDLRSGRKYERMRIIYSYSLYSFTLLHHFASAFGPKFSLPGIVDFAFIFGETILFILEAIVGRWAFPIPHVGETVQFDSKNCKVSTIYLGLPATVTVFTWAISFLLILSTTMRLAQALVTNGKYLWTRYDIAGLYLKPKHETRPNGLQVLLGVRLWKPHFKSEGNWIVRSRGIVAIILIALILGMALNSLIVDPIRETNEVLVKTSMSQDNPTMQLIPGDTIVIVGTSRELPDFNPNPVDVLSKAVRVVDWSTGKECPPTTSAVYEHPVTMRDKLIFTNFLCPPFSTISVSVNFSKIKPEYFTGENQVQVIISHSNDSLTSIRRTELPVILLPGMDLLGFAHHQKVRQFRNPRLSAFGLFVAFDEFIITEITQLQPNTRSIQRLPSDNNSASLLVSPRYDYSNLKIIEDYREGTVLKGFSDIGGLWTIVAFVFGSLFGSSLVRVAFDIYKLRARAGLLTLLVDHLIDLDLFVKDSATNLPDGLGVVNEEVIEMTTAHRADELAVEEAELAALCPPGEQDAESMLESNSTTVSIPQHARLDTSRI